MDIHTIEPLPELVARAEAEREEVGDGRVRPFVVELANRGRIRAEEWAVAMNSYERAMLVPHLETEVFVQQVEHCLRNCEQRHGGVSYDDALKNRYAPDALRRIREMSDGMVSQQCDWERVCEGNEELDGKLRASRAEVARLTTLLSWVINWCDDKPEDERPSPFKRDTYKDGIRYAKHTIRTRVLGRLEPDGECQGCGARGSEQHLAGCPTVGEEASHV